MVITPLSAVILGIVEGITEFLPISSTGHMILVARWLGIPENDPGVKAFEVVIQTGALLAVFGIYIKHILRMARGVFGADRSGLDLLVQLIVATMPALIVGKLGGDWIKGHLFGTNPVLIALVAGGILMIVVERWRKMRAAGSVEPQTAGRPLSDMTIRFAIIVGCAQVIAMWPGTSRSMITMIAALLLGFSPKAAAEFSFLLALPTLGAATAYDCYKHGGAIITASGWIGLALGFFVSFIVAWIAVKGFLKFLTHHGMELFGWYRLALAAVVVYFLMM
ncbi:undecaprenyl-diphosphate phosphatase [bacterium]|nr:undecaprenyl-diphosphate phosphatase [bacterium]